MQWFTSDLHLGHANIIGFCDRPWPSLGAMNEALVARWNANVEHDDHVTILGDLCLGRREDTLPIVERLNGHKTLLPGNHDNLWPGGKRNWREWVPLYEAVGLTVLEMLPPQLTWPVVVGGVDAEMSHFPRYGDSHGHDRYSAWRPPGDGWLLHGHTHSTVRRDGMHLHVGVDAWDYAPVSEAQLRELMD